MDRKIIINFMPFDVYSKLYVIDTDGQILTQQDVTVANFKNITKLLCVSYGIKNVELIGSKDYLEKFADDIKTTFSKESDVNIKIGSKDKGRI